MIRTLTNSVLALTLVLGSCKKESTVETKTFQNQTVTANVSFLQKGIITVDLSDPKLLELCKQNQFSSEDVVELKAHLKKLYIENKSSADSLTFDDMDSIQFIVKSQSVAGDPIRFGDVKLGVIGKRSTMESVDIPITLVQKTAGDPIRVGDVKLGLQFKLKRNLKADATVNASVDWDLKREWHK
jgi:hypothetical protein